MAKENFIRNMEERIEKINTKDDQKKRDVERFSGTIKGKYL